MHNIILDVLYLAMQSAKRKYGGPYIRDTNCLLDTVDNYFNK